jgi:hypothetical protein
MEAERSSETLVTTEQMTSQSTVCCTLTYIRPTRRILSRMSRLQVFGYLELIVYLNTCRLSL